MSSQENRVGIIASTPLLQHRLQEVVAEAGYAIAVNTSPEKLNKGFLTNETIRLWIVELDEKEYEDFVQDLLEHTDAPILFGEGQVPGKNDEDYARWVKRMQEKLESFAPVKEDTRVAPEINLDALMNAQPPPSFELPEELKNAPSPNLGPVWVLCASLGGPQAVKELLDLLPKDIPATFLYSQHIDAGCLDALVQSIGRHTALKVINAEHGLQLANGCVNVVPVDHEIRFTHNDGILWQENAWSGPYGPSHDHLLANVVEHYGKRCHTMIFSGMGSDGAVGSAMIKDQGGTVWAQSTDSCVQSSMPDSAFDAGTVDWRGTPSEMAEKLIRWLAEHREIAA